MARSFDRTAPRSGGAAGRAKVPASEARLAALRTDPSIEEVRDALRSSSGILVAAAVKHVTEPLTSELPRAFGHLLERANQRDPGCRGKVAVVRALYELERWDGVFAQGVRYVQKEPAFGGSIDTAGELRGICGLAHAHFARPDALDVLAELLMDHERNARIAAARGLGDAGRIDVAALLRFKLRLGDEEPEVLAACCESLFHLQREIAVPFVASMLEGEYADVAAIALGASKLADAVAPIVAWCERCLPVQRRRIGYLALALCREVNDQLLDVIRSGEPADALAAARALATFKDDPALRAKIREAGRGRRELAFEIDELVE